MDDMNVWDCAEQFTFPQAAALIAGIDPTRADLTPHERAKVSLVERRLRGEASKANARAFLMTQCEIGELVPPVGILSNETIAEARAGGASEFAPQPLESASRAEIAVWLRRTMIRSHYMFDLKPAEPSWTVRLPAPHAAIPYGTAARLIADQVEPESIRAVMAWRCKLVTAEIGPNHLQARFRGGQPIPAGTLIGGLNGMQDAYVRSDELGQWLVVQRYSVEHDQERAPAPQVDDEPNVGSGDATVEPASVPMVAAQNDEQGLTTSAVAKAFAPLWGNEAQWLKLLRGKRPIWLKQKCLLKRGARGAGSAREATWRPVEIAAAMACGVHKREACAATEIENCFKSRPALKPWLADWQAWRTDHPAVG